MKLPISILGATGMVGQQMVLMLNDHPYFKIEHLCASKRSLNKKYKDAVNWMQEKPIPENIKNMICSECLPFNDTKLAFSALDSSIAGKIETDFAENGYFIISNSKNHRMDTDVPLVIPEINPEHFSLIEDQQKKYTKKGSIITNPNCSTIAIAMVIGALKELDPKKVIITTMQSLSGAGFPGVSALEINNNIIPYIKDEEEKIESETLKILSKLNKKNEFIKPNIKISAQVNRVPVIFGHTITLNIGFSKKVTINKIKNILSNYPEKQKKLNLLSSPENIFVIKEEENRPQPKLDVNINNGMSIIIGKIKKCNCLDIKMTILEHNTIRGAAGAAILNGEFIYSKWLAFLNKEDK